MENNENGKPVSEYTNAELVSSLNIMRKIVHEWEPIGLPEIDAANLQHFMELSFEMAYRIRESLITEDEL